MMRLLGRGGVRAAGRVPRRTASDSSLTHYSLDVKRLDVKRLHVDTTTTLIVMEDEVDRLVAAWRRERPDLDVEPLEVLSRVSRLARHLDRARRLAFSEHSLEPWEFDVLTALRRAGTPYQLSPGQLLTQTLVTSGTMTNRIDRLAKKGLVERLPDPSDRRGVLVRLTDGGPRPRRPGAGRPAGPGAGDPRRS